MKDRLKKLYNENAFFYYLFLLPKFIYDRYRQNLPAEVYLSRVYRKIHGVELNLAQPVKFTEKIQWLKIHDRNPLYTVCADKYSVKKYIEDKLGPDYVIPLVFQTENPKDIDAENLPDYPVMVKTTHGSGGTYVIENKSQTDFRRIQKELKRALKENYGAKTREWEYKNIKPRIIVEKLLKDDSGNDVLNDYKIHCFHGEPLYIQTIFDRHSEAKEDWYDTQWNLLDVCYFSPIKKNVPKPELLDELLEISRKLSKDFLYVRVDLYIANNRIYFGELTFRPYSGWMKFQPAEFDRILGEKLTLPVKN